MPMEQGKINKVSIKKLSKIIENRVPTGLFYSTDNDIVVAVDNDTGDAWTEEFENVKSAIKWLKGGR